MQQVEEFVWAPIRKDLVMYEGPPDDDGSSTWVLYDPLIHSFYRLGWFESKVVEHWHLQDFTKIADIINDTTTLTADKDGIIEVGKFLMQNDLLEKSSSQETEKLLQKHRMSQHSIWMWMVHNYLYIKIPLVNPNGFLNSLLHYLSFMFTKQAVFCIAALFFIGIWQITNQFDLFIASFYDFFSLDKTLFYGLTLFFAKIIHEIGHGLVAKYYGVNVPSMGIVFMVMFPLLYTDVSDSWRLKDNKKRALIGAAGMMAESIVVSISMILWPILPEGTLKSATFTIIAVIWIATLLTNLNPLLKFDGYYILSDILDIPNLLDRSFNLALWTVRQKILGFIYPCPENLPQSRQRIMLWFAFGVWLYRLIIFTGIAIMVYFLFFKMLGIILFAVEIYYFILRPIIKELIFWVKVRKFVTLRLQNIISLSILSSIFVLLFYPWNTNVILPAVLHSETFQHIYSPIPAKLIASTVENNKAVSAGDILYTLHSDDLEYKIYQKKQEIEKLEERLFLSRSYEDIHQETGATAVSRIAELKSEYQGLLDQKAKLTIKSPINGIVLDVAETDLGSTINTKYKLATVIDPQDGSVSAYVNNTDLSYLYEAKEAVFIPENDPQTIPLLIKEIDKRPTSPLPFLALSTKYGGKIATKHDVKSNEIPESTIFRVSLVPINKISDVKSIRRGTVHIKSKPKSILGWLGDFIVAGVIKESGF